jgi:hypothetical protein
MNKQDWYSTSMNTNNAEAMHAYSKRSGTRQTLLTAVQKSQTLDAIHFERKSVIVNTGIVEKYGNTSSLGRAGKNLKRNTSAVRKRKGNTSETKDMKDILTKAQDLVALGVDPKVLEQFLITERGKSNLGASSLA